MKASEVMGPHRAEAGSVLSVIKPTRHFIWISMCHLFILTQVSASLFVSAAVFIRSDDFFISPFRMCLTHEDGEVRRSALWGAESEITINHLLTVVILGLYIPVVLVPFSLLAIMFAAYTKDGSLLWVSVLCQAASSLLMLTGIIVFLFLNLPFLAWENMTLWFYNCVAVPVELVITTVLTHVLRRRL
ncbi:unnamed protein product [Pleuronectes platessa]|uniref:Uncharacterized protein n=1 Tax=Pleuronectes platessa TaxID=8262 RepID=A0A9N7V1H5_PLEPL|nr:unnamed protein product [Pleuronectes platessa]